MRGDIRKFVLKQTGGVFVTGTGESLPCKDHIDKAVQVSGVFVGTLQIEGTINDTDWFDVGGPSIGPNVLAVPSYCAKLRVNTTAYTSGTPVVHFGGMDVRG